MFAFGSTGPGHRRVTPLGHGEDWIRRPSSWRATFRPDDRSPKSADKPIAADKPAASDEPVDAKSASVATKDKVKANATDKAESAVRPK